MTRRVHVLIAGRVQGVWFRESTRREAERLGLAGWVRNLDDGRVEALFEGPDGAVAEILRWCHHGPPAAEVRDLAASELAPAGEPPGFRVRRDLG